MESIAALWTASTYDGLYPPRRLLRDIIEALVSMIVMDAFGGVISSDSTSTNFDQHECAHLMMARHRRVNCQISILKSSQDNDQNARYQYGC